MVTVCYRVQEDQDQLFRVLLAAEIAAATDGGTAR